MGDLISRPQRRSHDIYYHRRNGLHRTSRRELHLGLGPLRLGDLGGRDRNFYSWPKPRRPFLLGLGKPKQGLHRFTNGNQRGDSLAWPAPHLGQYSPELFPPERLSTGTAWKTTFLWGKVPSFSGVTSTWIAAIVRTTESLQKTTPGTIPAVS
jgi:hypothetical protein